MMLFVNGFKTKKLKKIKKNKIAVFRATLYLRPTYFTINTSHGASFNTWSGTVPKSANSTLL